MNRRLGNFETAQVLTDEFSAFNVVTVMKLKNFCSAEIVQKALNHLQRRHPLLRVCIIKKKRKYYFQPITEQIIELSSVQRLDDNQWRKITEKEMNTRFDVKKGPLMRCVLLFDTAQSKNELIITIHHSIIDGASGLNIIEELLSLCEKISAGNLPKDFEPLHLLHPEKDYFPSQYRGIGRISRTIRFMAFQIFDEIKFRIKTRGKRKPMIHTAGTCRILTMQIPDNLTEKLIRISREQRITMYHVCNAAMVTAAARRIYESRDILIRHFNFPDLRPFLKPPVSKENLGTFHSVMRSTIAYKSDQSFWDLAGYIQQITQKSIRRGDKFISAIMSLQMMKMIFKFKSFRMGTTALSYIGSPSIRLNYGRMVLNDFHIFVSNLVLGPEFTGHAKITDGALGWELVYMDSDMNFDEASNIAVEIKNILQCAVDDYTNYGIKNG